MLYFHDGSAEDTFLVYSLIKIFMYDLAEANADIC